MGGRAGRLREQAGEVEFAQAHRSREVLDDEFPAKVLRDQSARDFQAVRGESGGVRHWQAQVSATRSKRLVDGGPGPSG
jgi:hypothetical protein